MLIQFLNRLFGGTWKLKERCRLSSNIIVKWLTNWVYTRALQAKGSWISADAQFTCIPCFPHGIYGIFISGGVSVGRNCVIFQQVTIGSNTLIDSSGFGAPTIGDNCYIGAGAKIIGKVKVGNNVRVAANAVVVRDVPDNSVVYAGEQSLVTRDHALNNRFYHKYEGRWCYYENGSSVPVEDLKDLDLLEARFLVRK